MSIASHCTQRIRIAVCLVSVLAAPLTMAQSQPTAGAADREARPAVTPATTTLPAYTPVTQGERAKYYVQRMFSPESVLRSAAGAAINQALDTPHEWHQGAEGYGRRFASSYSEHIIQATTMYGTSAIFHEDNRYFRSGKSGFGNRLVYALTSTVLARHDDGDRYVSASRLLSYAAAASLSRLWQPPSTSRLANAGRVFGITLGVEAGFNVAREFFPMIFHSHAPVAEPQP
jgi:hypothetical protein